MNQGIKEDCRVWGRYIATDGSGWSSRNALDRVIKEGPAAGSGSFRDAPLPIRHSCPSEVMYVHRAYVNEMTADEKAVFYLHFAVSGKPAMKAKVLGLSTATYYRRLGVAFSVVAGFAEFD